MIVPPFFTQSTKKQEFFSWSTKHTFPKIKELRIIEASDSKLQENHFKKDGRGNKGKPKCMKHVRFFIRRETKPARAGSTLFQNARPKNEQRSALEKKAGREDYDKGSEWDGQTFELKEPSHTLCFLNNFYEPLQSEEGRSQCCGHVTAAFLNKNSGNFSVDDEILKILLISQNFSWNLKENS